MGLSDDRFIVSDERGRVFPVFNLVPQPRSPQAVSDFPDSELAAVRRQATRWPEADQRIAEVLMAVVLGWMLWFWCVHEFVGALPAWTRPWLYAAPLPIAGAWAARRALRWWRAPPTARAAAPL